MRSLSQRPAERHQEPTRLPLGVRLALLPVVLGTLVALDPVQAYLTPYSWKAYASSYVLAQHPLSSNLFALFAFAVSFVVPVALRVRGFQAGDPSWHLLLVRNLLGQGPLILSVVAVLPLAAWGTLAYLGSQLGHPKEAEYFIQNISTILTGGFWAAVAGLIVGLVAAFALGRHAEPAIGAWLQVNTRRAQQHGLTDVGLVNQHFPKIGRFNPERYFRRARRREQVFLGLGRDGKPVCVSRSQWQTSNIQIVGPPGAGKGVQAAVTLAQSITLGDAVFVFDPKDDEWGKSAYHAACEKAGKPFFHLDFRPTAPPQSNPIGGISPQDLEELFVAAFGMATRGGDADIHRLREQRAAHDLSEMVRNTPMTLADLVNHATEALGKEECDRVEGFLFPLRGVARIPAICTHQAGHIEHTLQEGGCLYITGSTTYPATISLQRMILLRLIQMIRRRPRGQRHVTVFIDETKYFLSRSVVDSLGVLRDRGCNFLLAHQSLGDLGLGAGDMGADDQRTTIIDNCTIRWVYQTKDPTTARWVVDQGGTTIQTKERVSVGRNPELSETISGGRMLDQIEYPLIDMNIVQHLPKNCAVCIGVGLATVVHTSPLTVQKKEFTPTAAPPVHTTIHADPLLPDDGAPLRREEMA